jgi:predicted GNAT family N-acyltransferase
MPKLRQFPSKKLPVALKWQLVTFARVEWSYAFMGANRLWDFITPKDHPRHFVITEDQTLISHAEVVWREVKHQQQVYKVYGLGAVFTFPSFRGEGYGGQVVAAATEYIKRQHDADVALVFAPLAVCDFFAAYGWSRIDNEAVLYGRADNPAHIGSDEGVLALYLSARAKRRKAALHGLYIGASTW